MLDWTVKNSSLGQLYLFENRPVALPQQRAHKRYRKGEDREREKESEGAQRVRRPSSLCRESHGWISAMTWVRACVRETYSSSGHRKMSWRTLLYRDPAVHPRLRILNAFPTKVIPLSRLLRRKPLICEMNGVTQRTLCAPSMTVATTVG